MPEPDTTPVRRSWGQRGLIAALVIAVLAASGTAGSLAYANRRVSDVERAYIPDNVLADDDSDPGDPMNILIVGIDDASRLADDDPAKAFRDSPDVMGQHTDSMMILRLDPRATTAQILSLPRDLWVTIAESGVEQRINTAFQTGGPTRLIKTIDENFGIPIHHFVQVDFAGFGELVSIVDGVPVQFPRPTRDRESGLAIDEPGCYTLGPRQALGFARARHYQVRDADGRWHEDPRSDFSRIARQQLFIELALTQAIAKGARNPNTLRRLVDLGTSAVRFDDSFEVGSLVDVGIRYRNFRPRDLQRFELYVVDDIQGGAEVLSLVEEASEPTLAVFRGVEPDDPNALQPEEVTVQVLNGTGVQGQGGQATEAMGLLGFTTLATGDADETGLPTTVRYVPGGEAAARLLARAVAGPVTYQRADGLGGADAVLITGSDWAGVADELRPLDEVEGPAADPTATTTTTTAPASSDPGTAGDPGAPGDTGSADEEGATTTTEAVDSDDPRDPAFYLAHPAPEGASCPRTD